jgi:hypothetical protein
MGGGIRRITVMIKVSHYSRQSITLKIIFIKEI